MSAQKPQRSGKSATANHNSQQYYSADNGLDNISASESNEIKNNLNLLKIDFDRIFNGYRQLGIAHAELLLELDPAWREYLLHSFYVNSLHPDVRADIATFLESVKKYSGLRGAI